MNSAPMPQPSGSSILGSLGKRLVHSISRYERAWLVLALVVFGLSAAYQACIFPLWFDEFFTLFLSRLPTLKQLYQAMPADGQPPLQYLLTHVSLRWFGATEFAMRLPELLAYGAAGLLAWKIVRRHGSAVQALFAAVFLLDSVVPELAGWMARPYGLLLAFTALTLASWQVAALREENRFWPLCGVTAGIAGAVCSHHFGLVHTAMLLAAGEATRIRFRRRLDGWMAVAIAAGYLPLMFTLPLAHRSRVLLGEAVFHSANFWAKPSVSNLLVAILLVSIPLLCLSLVFALLPWPKQDDGALESAITPVPAHEWAAALSLSLMLPVQLLLAFTSTGYFQEKYAIGTSLGLALLCGWGLPRVKHLRRTWPFVLGLATTCVLLFAATQLAMALVRHPINRSRMAHAAVSPLLEQAPGNETIAVANAFDYVPDWWYSAPAIRERLTYLSDVPYAIQQPEFLPELSLALDREYVPAEVADYSGFLASHTHFLLLCSGRPRLNWIEPRLRGSGWELTPLARSGADTLYRVDRGN